jgi:release factor glutamine methyltransferase
MSESVSTPLDQTNTLTVEAALSQAHDRCERIDQRILLAHAMERPIAWLLAHPEAVLNEQENQLYSELLSRRENGEPIAYLTGEKEFHGLSFEVNPSVLIPRPETELLVDRLLEAFPPGVAARVADLGTGSGVIAVTLAARRPLLTIVAVDKDEAALAVAQRNAERMGVSNRVEFRVGQWFSNLKGEQFDAVVSNPPYIAALDAHLSQGDLRFEPKGALVGGPDGLLDLAAIIDLTPSHLPLGGLLALEHGYDQAGVVRRLMEMAGFVNIQSSLDIAGIERVTAGRYRIDRSETPGYAQGT